MATPGAVAHERHEALPTLRITAAGAVAPVAEMPLRFHFESGAVAPGAVWPVELRAAVATRALGWKARRLMTRLGAFTAPGASQHEFRHWPRAMPALEPRIQQAAIFALELIEQHLLPEDGVSRRPRPGAPLASFAGATRQPLELAVHDVGVLVALLGSRRDRTLQPRHQLRTQLLPESLEPGRRPVVGPFGQMPGQQLVDDEPQREHIRLKHRTADGLLRRDIAYGARARRLDCPLGDLGEAEVRQTDLTRAEENEIVGLDVAMNDSGKMRVSDG